jgi:RNA polymerase sigma factor (sigma-70 family)
VVLAVFVTGVVISLASGTPRSLPAVALGAALLLHLERAAVGAGLVAGLFIVMLYLLRGELPSKVSTTGVEWSAITQPERVALEKSIQAVREAVEELQKIPRTATDPPGRWREVDEAVNRAETAVNEAEQREAIADAIAQLPDREKLVIALYYYEGMKLDEVAPILGMSEQQVRQLRTKAVLRLRRTLGEDPRLEDFFGR